MRRRSSFATLNGASPPKQMPDHRNDRQDHQQVNQPTGHVEYAESQDPEHEKHERDREKHSASLASWVNVRLPRT